MSVSLHSWPKWDCLTALFPHLSRDISRQVEGSVCEPARELERLRAAHRPIPPRGGGAQPNLLSELGLFPSFHLLGLTLG